MHAHLCTTATSGGVCWWAPQYSVPGSLNWVQFRFFLAMKNSQRPVFSTACRFCFSDIGFLGSDGGSAGTGSPFIAREAWKRSLGRISAIAMFKRSWREMGSAPRGRTSTEQPGETPRVFWVFFQRCQITYNHGTREPPFARKYSPFKDLDGREPPDSQERRSRGARVKQWCKRAERSMSGSFAEESGGKDSQKWRTLRGSGEDRPAQVSVRLKLFTSWFSHRWRFTVMMRGEGTRGSAGAGKDLESVGGAD